MAELKEGDQAPEFTLPACEPGSPKGRPSGNGGDVSLRDFNGKKRVVLYFYPKDDTPGCTIEACEFRDLHAHLVTKDIVVLGVSPDPMKSHSRFIQKFNLPFVLLSDEEKKTCRDYGVWVEKSLYGKTYMGVNRATFIIGKDGRIEKIYSKVKAAGHAEEVLEFLESHGAKAKL